MKIKVSLSVGGEIVKYDDIEINDFKLEELSQEEIEESIEIQIRSWADRNIQITWEVEES